MVCEQEVELRIGDSLLVGELRVTVVDIDGDEVVFRVDDSTGPDPSPDVVIRPR